MNNCITLKLTLERLSSIESAADLLESVYGDSIDDMLIPIDVDSIIKHLEKICYSNESSFGDWDKSGYIKVNRNSYTDDVDTIEIWVNPSEIRERQRFTAAHEIGHLIHDIVPNLGNKSVNESFVDTFNRSTERNLVETRANKFAAQLLMPAKLIARELRVLVETIKKEERKVSVNEIVKKMASKFQVSDQAMEIRLSTLGYIT